MCNRSNIVEMATTWAFGKLLVLFCWMWEDVFGTALLLTPLPAVCACFCACVFVRWQRGQWKDLHPGGRLQQHPETQGLQHEVDFRWGGPSVSKWLKLMLYNLPGGYWFTRDVTRPYHTWIWLVHPAVYDIFQHVDGSEFAETDKTPIARGEARVLVHAELFSPR